MINLLYYLRMYFSLVAWKKRLVTQSFESIYDVNFDLLKKRGIKAIVFDVDDTLRGHLDSVPKRTIILLQSLYKKGFKIAFFSNMSLRQKEEISKEFGKLPVLLSGNNNKPNPKWFFDFFKKNNLAAKEVVVLGDKVGTDIFAAYLAGVEERILVEPYSEVFGALKASANLRFIRWFEKALFFK